MRFSYLLPAIVFIVSGCATPGPIAAHGAINLPDQQASIAKTAECTEDEYCGLIISVRNNRGETIVEGSALLGGNYNAAKLVPGVYEITLIARNGNLTAFPRKVIKMKPGFTYILSSQGILSDTMVRILHKEVPTVESLSWNGANEQN